MVLRAQYKLYYGQTGSINQNNHSHHGGNKVVGDKVVEDKVGIIGNNVEIIIEDIDRYRIKAIIRNISMSDREIRSTGEIGLRLMHNHHMRSNSQDNGGGVVDEEK